MIFSTSRYTEHSNQDKIARVWLRVDGLSFDEANSIPNQKGKILGSRPVVQA